MIKKTLLLSNILFISLFALSTNTLNAAPKVLSVKEIKAEKEKYYAEELVLMKKRDATKDAEAAKNLGFPYLLAHHAGRSVTMVIPGLDQNDAKMAQSRCPILILDGLGDMIYGQNHMSYRKAMTDYAAEFNKINYKACVAS